MPDSRYTTITGTVTHIFGHRFVINTRHGDVLADLTPKGLEQIVLRLNDDVILEGEMKPSELKVVRLTRAGRTVVIEPKPKPHHHRDHHAPYADPSIVLAAAPLLDLKFWDRHAASRSTLKSSEGDGTSLVNCTSNSMDTSANTGPWPVMTTNGLPNSVT